MNSLIAGVTAAVLLVFAGPAAAQSSGGGSVAARATIPSARLIYIPMTSEPPSLTDAQKARLAQEEARHPYRNAVPLPEGTTAVQRPDSTADPGAGTPSPARPTQSSAPSPSGMPSMPSPPAPSTPSAPAPSPSGAESAVDPGTFTIFRNAYMGATIKANTSGLTGEPNVANAGAIVFATGNWFAGISGNGGRTFSFINPATTFPASFGGFCCDQKAVYDPSRDIFIWYLQYVSSGPVGAGQNLFRVAVARPADALRGFWFYYDFTSAVNTEWDYPDMSLSNDSLWITTNRGVFNSNSVNDAFMFKIPLDPISTGGGLSYLFLDLAAAGVSNLSLKCSHGAHEVMYFGSHNSTSQIRIFSWAEDSGTIFWNSVNLSATWANGTHICPTPDNRPWCGFDDGRMQTGWIQTTRQGKMVGFMWNAAGAGGASNCNGTALSCPYVEAARVFTDDHVDPPVYTYYDRPFLFVAGNMGAFQYPAAAPNARGDLGITAYFSSAGFDPYFLVGIDDDFHRTVSGTWDVSYIRESSQGPNSNRWGDYYKVAPYNQDDLTWITIGQTLQGCGGAGCKESNFVIFGRARDTNGTPLYATANRDFNGDGRSDILWRNTSGQVYEWQMDGPTIVGAGTVGSVGSDWQIVGVGDFNGDGGKGDILWRHTSGAVYIWLLNGTSVIGAGSPGTLSADWSIAGIGDFNGDGMADILWRHTSGMVDVWLMNGTTVAVDGSPGSAGTDWQIVGTGDFNTDGRDDILWRNTTSGMVYQWFLNGTGVIGGGSPGTVTADWSIVGVGDFNADGKADILWRNTSGLVYEWLMNGTSVIGGGSPGSVGLDWTIQRVGDFNGDGHADILWRHTSGQVYEWLLYGTTLIGAGSPGSAGMEWTIQ